MIATVRTRHTSAWRLLPASALLYALWTWQPATPVPLPDGTVQPADAAALAALPAGTPFLIEGNVHLANAAAALPWQGRTIYIQRKRIDQGGQGSSRHQAVETITRQRPALHFHWNATRIPVAADSYGLDNAPRITPKWNDSWDRSSRGFRDGDAALALGHTGDDGHVRIESLLETPLAAVQKGIRSEHHNRVWLIVAAKIIATLLVLAWLSPLWGGRQREIKAPLPPR